MTEELVSVGLLDVIDGWFCLHDWEEWQVALDRVIRDRDRDAARKRRARSGVDVPSDASGVDREGVSGLRARQTRGRESYSSLSPSLDGTSAVDRAAPAGAGPAPRSAQDRTEPRRGVELIPELQQAGPDGLRPFVRNALQAYRNTGLAAFLLEALREESVTHDEAKRMRSLLDNSETRGDSPPGDGERDADPRPSAGGERREGA